MYPKIRIHFLNRKKQKWRKWMKKIRLTKIQKSKLNKKQKNKALLRFIQLQELRLYQAELVKLQKHFEKNNLRMVVIFEGRDASGKGGTIRRILEDLNPKHARTIAKDKPSSREKGQDYFQRYTNDFPGIGEIVLFDRSWYNRTMVEPALDFCTQKQYEDHINRIAAFEKFYFYNNSQKTNEPKTIFLKFYFSITKEEQKRRFKKRKTNPRKGWKFSEADAQMQDKWNIFTELKYRMLKKTNTSSNPWEIIRSEDKHEARRTAMKLMLRSVETYKGKNQELDYTLDQDVWIPGNVELAEMKAKRSSN